jgi:hypothetical protein
MSEPKTKNYDERCYDLARKKRHLYVLPIPMVGVCIEFPSQEVEGE